MESIAGGLRDGPCVSGVRQVVLYAVVALVAVLPYLHTLSYPFMWDDDQLIVENPVYRQGAAWRAVWNPDRYRNLLAQNSVFYRPIPSLTFALDRWLWALEPSGFRLTNLLLHALVACLAFAVLRRLSSDAAVAFPAAVLFALHPVHLEAVVWIKCRSELLAAGAFLAGFLAFTVPGRRLRVRLPVAALFLVVGLACKQTAITLPVVLALWVCYVRPPETWRREFGAVLSLVAIAGLYAVGMRLLFPDKQFPAEIHGVMLAWWQHLAAVLVSLFQYGRLLLVPVGLTAHHALHVPTNWLDGLFVVWPLVALASFALVVRGVVLRLPWAFAIAWVLLTLGPSANIVMIPGRPLAEQRLLLPSLGYALLLALGIRALARLAAGEPGRRAVTLGAMLILSLAYTLSLAAHSRVWRDSEAFWRDAQRRNPHGFMANVNLGVALIPKGRLEEARALLERAAGQRGYDAVTLQGLALIASKQARWEEALDYGRRAAEAAPGRADLAAQQAVYLLESGVIRDATAWLERAAALDPVCPDLLVARALAAKRAGALEEAVTRLRQAIETNPRAVTARYHLALLLRDRGETQEAVRLLERARALAPREAEIALELGKTRAQVGDVTAALAGYRHAAALEGSWEARFRLGDLLLRLDRPEDALPWLREAVQRAPEEGAVWKALAEASLSTGDWAGAGDAFQRASVLVPADAEVQSNLGILLVEAGRYEEGLEHLRQAVKLAPGDARLRANLALGCLKTGRLEEAATLYRILVREDHYPLDAYRRLAESFRSAGEMQRAREIEAECERLAQGLIVPATR